MFITNAIRYDPSNERVVSNMTSLCSDINFYCMRPTRNTKRSTGCAVPGLTSLAGPPALPLDA